MRASNARMARQVVASRRNLDERQCIIEGCIGLAWIVDHLDWPVPNRSDRSPVSDRDERRKSEISAIVPALGNHLRADSSRIAERYRKRGGSSADHSSRP